MTITLRPEQERAIAQAIESGAYQDVGEVIDRALETLRAEDEWLLEMKAAINEKIERAIGQIDSGQGISAADLEDRLRVRKQAFLDRRNS